MKKFDTKSSITCMARLSKSDKRYPWQSHSWYNRWQPSSFLLSIFVFITAGFTRLRTFLLLVALFLVLIDLFFFFSHLLLLQCLTLFKIEKRICWRKNKSLLNLNFCKSNILRTLPANCVQHCIFGHCRFDHHHHHYFHILLWTYSMNYGFKCMLLACIVKSLVRINQTAICISRQFMVFLHVLLAKFPAALDIWWQKLSITCLAWLKKSAINNFTFAIITEKWFIEDGPNYWSILFS